LRYNAETASLRTIAAAVSAAVTRLLRWHAWWLGTGDVDPAITFALSDEFFSLKATADEVRASLLLFQADSISFDTFFHQLQLGGWTRDGVTADQEREPSHTRARGRGACTTRRGEHSHGDSMGDLEQRRSGERGTRRLAGDAAAVRHDDDATVARDGERVGLRRDRRAHCGEKPGVDTTRAT
jgi:hypothetical protein